MDFVYIISIMAVILLILVIYLIWALFNERIKEFYYKRRFPESTIKILIFYTSHIYRVFWRLVPDNKMFDIGKKKYFYSDEDIIRNSELFAYGSKKDKMLVKIDGVEYEVKNECFIKRKGHKSPEIHYFYDNPSPIMYDFKNKSVNFTSKDVQIFSENDLFTKLLTLREEAIKMLLLMVLVAVNLLATVFLLAKYMKWIK